MAGKKKPLVVITRKLPDPVETRMRELFDARLNIDDKPMSREALAAAMQEADVLVPTITDRIDDRLIAGAGENLKLIANFGNGVDHIDVAAAAKKGIAVTNTPNVLTEDTADMTMALILTVPRRLIEGASVARRTRQMGRLVADLDARPAHLGQAARHRRHGPHRHGGGARAPRPSACRSTTTTASASCPLSRTSWRRPTGRASTRCWRAWTSSRSTAPRRRRPSTCCPAGGWRCCSRPPTSSTRRAATSSTRTR